MNTLIANQYGRVEGEAARNALTLSVTAQTPRREPVQLQTCIDSVEQQLHLLAILRAVERRIEQFQVRDAKTAQTGDQESPFDETICSEGDLFNSNGSSSKNKIYGRFSQFLVYEQVDQGRLRVFFAVRDEAKRVARFDLHPGEVQAMHTLARLTLFSCEQIDLLLRDELSVSVTLSASRHGLRFEVQVPLWRSEFVISQANDLATLAVFTRRVINQEKTIPIKFGGEVNQLTLRRRTDGQVLAEFQYDGAMERVALSTLQLYELEILAQYALHRAFEPPSFAAGTPVLPETATAA